MSGGGKDGEGIEIKDLKPNKDTRQHHSTATSTPLNSTHIELASNGFRSWLWLKEESLAAKPQTPLKAAMHRLPTTHAKTLTKSEMSRE